MWPFKKKVIKKEIIKPIKPIKPETLSISCVCKCILNDLETRPEQDWNIDYIDGSIEFSIKGGKYKLYRNNYYFSLVDIYINFNGRERDLLLSATNKLLEARNFRLDKERELESEKKLKEIFPECYK